MPKSKRKGIIPPLQFVYEPIKKIPYNADYLPCTENYPKVNTIPADDKNNWIEPHFEYSQKCVRIDVVSPVKLKHENSIEPLEFCSDRREIERTSLKPAKCHLVSTILPPVTPEQNRIFRQVLVSETPRH